MSKTALAIPAAANPIPRDWWREHALPAVDDMDDINEANEAIRRMAALAKYVKDREQRFELDAGRIVAEMRIGRLIGDGKPGPLPESSPAGEVSEKDRWKFRQLAKHRKLVLKLLEERIASRRRILARLERPRRNRPEGSTLTEVRQGDFREVLDDLAGSVDAIVTDPPYPKKYLPLYADLSTVADRLLRPGGLCLVMSGQTHLPTVMDSLASHLEYRWIMAYLTPGASTMPTAQRVQTFWKPILVYEKLPSDLSHRISSDVVRSPGNDTDGATDHGWGQNEGGMFELIRRVTEPEWLIVDPFLGGGTTLVAAARAGRDSIGCDVDPKAVETAKARVG